MSHVLLGTSTAAFLRTTSYHVCARVVCSNSVNIPVLHVRGKSSFPTIESRQQPCGTPKTRGSTVALFSSTSTSTSSMEETISAHLREAYQQNQTDGILNLVLRAEHDMLSQASVVQLLEAAVIAATCPNGRVQSGPCASIVNALVAGTTTVHSNKDCDRSGEWAIEWFNLLIAGSISTDIKDILEPDLVTMSCIISGLHSAAQRHSADDFNNTLDEALKFCRKWSKKQAGSARRKALAASRRKKLLPDYERVLEEKHGISILYESDDFLGVCKPAGMLCHSVPGKKRKGDTSLEDALVNVGMSLSVINPAASGVVHRLDRGASGCLILAKNDCAHAHLVADFFRRDVNKSYLAFVPGVLDALQGDGDSNKGMIDEEVDNRPARSQYEVISTHGQHNKEASLLRVTTMTGRKHQVRAHMKHLGSPIFLDPIYFDAKKQADILPDVIIQAGKIDTQKSRKQQPAYRFFLHASTLKINRFGIELKVDIPSWWKETIEELDNKLCSD